MKCRRLIVSSLVSILLGACSATPPTSADESVGNAVAALSTQAIAVPSYFEDWSTMLLKAPPTRLAVINPNNGPNGTFDYSSDISRAQPAGVSVIGYVSTKYTNRSLTDPNDSVEKDIDTYFRLYPALDGIFFDETQIIASGTPCGSSDSIYAYYRDAAQYVRQRKANTTVVFNTGRASPSCYLNAADIVVTFEGSASTYLSSFSSSGRAWETAANASHLWHIIYDADASTMTTVVNASQARQAGYVYVTDRPLKDANGNWVNTFGALPPYWNSEADAVSAFATGQIRSYFAQNDTSSVYYEANFTVAFQRKHVFIDSDGDAATGYRVAGIGANYMIENDILYSMADGTSWLPTALGSANRSGAGSSVAGVTGWRVARSAINELGSPNQSKIVFHGGGAGTPDYFTPIFTQTFD